MQNLLSLLFVLIFSSMFLTACFDKKEPEPDTTITVDDTITDTTTDPTALVAEKDTSWNVVNFDPVANNIIFTGSKYVAVGDYGYIAESTDGQSWTVVGLDTAVNFVDVAANGNNVVAIPDSGNRLYGVAVTTDGVNWKVVDDFLATDCRRISNITHDGNQFVGVFDNVNICTSTDGTSWQLQSTQSVNLKKIVAGADKYVVLTSDGLATMTALDSTGMNVPSMPVTSGTYSDLVYDGSSMFVVIRLGTIMYSTNGDDWTSVSGTDVPSNVIKLSYSLSMGFVALDPTGWIYTSSDGMTWNKISNAVSFIGYNSLAASGLTETLILNEGNVYRSTDNINWSPSVVSFLTGNIQDLLTVNNVLYGVTHDSGEIYKSLDDGATWSPSLVSMNVKSLIHNGSRFIASRVDGISYSDDGTNWTNAFSYDRNNIVSASAKLGATTYYLSTGSQLLKSDDGVVFQAEQGIGFINGVGSSVPYKQVASNGSILVAMTQFNISMFDGSNWTAADISANVASYTTLTDLVWTGSEFVVVGDNATILTSTDGLAWTTQSWLNNASVSDVLVVDSVLYATDVSGVVASSSNGGVNWSLVKDFNSAGNRIDQLAYDGDKFYGFGYNASINTAILVASADTSTWSSSSVLTRISTKVFYDTSTSLFVTYTGSGEQVQVSSDAINWQNSSDVPTDSSFSFVNAKIKTGFKDFGPIKFTAGTPNTYMSGMAYSEDGISWVLKTDQDYYPGYVPQSGVYVATDVEGVGNFMGSSSVYTSIDGFNYTVPTITGINSSSAPVFKFAKYVNGQYVAVVSYKSDVDFVDKLGIYTSSDGANWSLQTEVNEAVNIWGGLLKDIEYDGTQYLFLYSDLITNSIGTMIIKTADLQNMTLLETGIKVESHNLIVDDNGYTLLGDFRTIATHALY